MTVPEPERWIGGIGHSALKDGAPCTVSAM